MMLCAFVSLVFRFITPNVFFVYCILSCLVFDVTLSFNITGNTTWPDGVHLCTDSHKSCRPIHFRYKHNICESWFASALSMPCTLGAVHFQCCAVSMLCTLNAPPCVPVLKSSFSEQLLKYEQHHYRYTAIMRAFYIPSNTHPPPLRATPPPPRCLSFIAMILYLALHVTTPLTTEL